MNSPEGPESISEVTELPVIELHTCPGKAYTRPAIQNEGLGILADIEYASNPANEEAIVYQTLCDIDCQGPVKVPRKILGITFGEKAVCRRGYERLINARGGIFRE